MPAFGRVRFVERPIMFGGWIQPGSAFVLDGLLEIEVDGVTKSFTGVHFAPRGYPGDMLLGTESMMSPENWTVDIEAFAYARRWVP